jgi:hypothetical protein
MTAYFRFRHPEKVPKMKTSFKGLVKLLAKSLYPESNVFIRELIQNAHDSIRLRRVEDPELTGKIEVITDPKPAPSRLLITEWYLLCPPGTSDNSPEIEGRVFALSPRDI